VGASYPGLQAATEQDAFDILGVRINGDTIPRFGVVLNDTLNGTLSVTNLSQTALTNFTLLATTPLSGGAIRYDTLPSLGAGATAQLGYSATGTIAGPWTPVTGQVQAAEGTIQPSYTWYRCQSAAAHLVADVTQISATASSSATQYLAQFRLVNTGAVASGPVQINLPQVAWLNTMTPSPLPSIAPGDTAMVVLRFLPLAEVPFDYPINGTLGVVAQNGNSFSLPFTFTKVSSTTGGLTVEAVNQMTYFAPGAPKVEGAFVRVRNYYTNEVYGEGLTDANGLFSIPAIPEGTHWITVEKQQHQGYAAAVTIVPGGTVHRVAFMVYNAVTYSWNVVPTAIQDQYDITLTAEFQTNIPSPVVTIDMPDSVPGLEAEEVHQFMVTLTNHGLIAARDVMFQLPQDDPEYEFITYYEPTDLPALSSVQVPVLMRRRVDAQESLDGFAGLDMAGVSQVLGIAPQQSLSPIGNLACSAAAIVAWWVDCALNSYTQSGADVFKYAERVCEFFGPDGGPGGPRWNPVFNPGGYGFGGGWDLGWHCPSCVGWDGYGTGTGNTPPPPAETEKKNCKECLNDLRDAALPLPDLGGSKRQKRAVKRLGLIDLLDVLLNCPSQAEGLRPLSSTSTSLQRDQAPWEEYWGAPFIVVKEHLDSVLHEIEIMNAREAELYEDLLDEDGWDDLEILLAPFVEGLIPIDVLAQTTILDSMSGYNMEQSSIMAFIVRWNTSLQARLEGVMAPNTEYPGIIHWALVDEYDNSLEDLNTYAVNEGYESTSDMYERTMEDLRELLDIESSSVCASVTMQISQQLTMTREAFSGTLTVFNGHPTDNLDSLMVNILITDEDGVPSNGLFQIETTQLIDLSDVTGTGSIAAQADGTVQYLFIPEIGAAPTEPKLYFFGGSITYQDPFADTLVTLRMSAVPLVVNPSPNLMLHYFMQRNILGDDALTSPAVEPSIPAELAVMVENHGYGPAVNMTISSAQPEVVGNESGLAINFELIGSNLQGQPTALGVIDIPFGTIPPLTTRVGQWYLTSSLLGKFVSYDADVVHANSFGNPDLSLVQGVELHELTHSILAYGALEDGITDFLVNDDFDPQDVPDIIYFSQGNSTAEVIPASSGNFSSPVSAPLFTNTLTVTPNEEGWNYIKLEDPGYGQYDLVSVTRDVDGQMIPLNNAWLTFVTLPINVEPQYENKFHFVDLFSGLTPVSYTVVWEPKNLDVPEVVSIEGAPAGVSAIQVTELTVTFNKPIDAGTFTYDDLTLVFQGGPDLMDGTVSITQVNDSVFTVDLSSLTTGNGTYVFTAQAFGIEDIYGIHGLDGRQVSWTQFLTVPAVQAFQGVPQPALASSYSTIQVLFNLPIDVSSATADRFSLLFDGEPLAGTLTIDSISSDLRLFYLSGLNALLINDGAYELVVDLPNIRSVDQEYGIQQQSITLTVDNMGPVLITLQPTTTGALDPQHRTYVEMSFDERVVGFNTSALQLTRNGQNIPLNIAQLSYQTPTAWKAGNFGMPTYLEGDYVFSIDLGLVADALGNTGTGVQQAAWIVDRSAGISVSNLNITPDLGYSDGDGVSSELAVDVSFELSGAATGVTVSQTTFGAEVVLATLANVASGPVSVPVTFTAGGNTGVKVVAVGGNGTPASAQRTLFLDQVPLSATWGIGTGTVVTEQISEVPLSFSDRVLNTASIANSIHLSRNGISVAFSSIGIEAVDERNYRITGIDAASASAGSYELSIDLVPLMKYSSGRSGANTVRVQWSVVPAPRILLAAKAFLGGPFVAGIGLMHDSLRVHGLVPLTEPYSGMGHTWIGTTSGAATTAQVLATSGSNAIVDWVIVELRNETDPTVVLAEKAALIQRDGDIVDVDGTSSLAFDLAPGRYHIAVRHRNHLGVMGANAVQLSASPTTVDLSDPNTVAFGTDARSMVGAKALLWQGNVVSDAAVRYTGGNNDRDPILTAIGGVVPTNTISGYSSADVNLDGVVKYTGQNNDRDPILQAIGGIVPTNVRLEQLPE
jgi:hypothetical protein